MQKKTSAQLLSAMIPLLIENLEELSSAPDDDPFAYGEKTAYVECLEWLQAWEHAEKFGLNFEVEKRFPL